MLPIVVLVLGSWGGLVLLQERSLRSQARQELSNEGTTALREFTHGVQSARQVQATYARLLEQTPGLASATQRSDRTHLSRLLRRTGRHQAFQQITIYNRAGALVVNVGRPVGDRIDAALFGAARLGRTSSEAVVDPTGLLMLASTPVQVGHKTVGVLVVGTTLSGADLGALRHQQGAELAIFQDGTLVATSARRPEVLGALRAVPAGGLAERLGRTLERVDFFPTVRRLDDGGAVVVLASTANVERLSAQRKLLLLFAAALLLGALGVVSFFLSRSVLRPLDAMAAAAADMVGGDYRVRVAASRIPELDTLATGVNHLAERVEAQLGELSHQAFHDRLTGLPNRALFVDRLEHGLANAGRAGRSVAVVFIDLDNFKFVNDTLGHEMADQLLIAVGERLRSMLRPADTLARQGGDEFTVLLEDVARIDDCLEAVARIESAFELPFRVAGQELFVTASIGLTLGAGSAQPDALLSEADLAMYRAKANGKARLEIFDEAMSAQLEERLELETDLRRALERDELVLHYQPIIDIETGRIEGVEALVRWAHPVRGLLPPLLFIPIAEQSGLIVPLGEWVLRKACLEVGHWQEETGVPLGVSVNVSSRQFQHNDLVADVERVLEETGFDPQLLKLELTESVVAEDVESVLDKMTALAALGIDLVIDDFGVEYSSLVYLKRFPVEGLKIDRQFVDGLERDPADAAIVRATVDVARALDLSVTAEGVENEAQLDILRSLGCRYAQGYYFAKPLPPERVPALLAEAAARLAEAAARLAA